MNETVQAIVGILQPALLTFIEAAVAAGVPLLLWKFNAWMKSKVHNASFHCAMDKVTTVAESSVLDVSQTYVKGVRKSGKWNGTSALAAKTKALDLAKERLGPKGLKELMGCLGHDGEGVSGVLSGAIESAVARFKNENALPKGGHAADVLEATDDDPDGETPVEGDASGR